VIDRPLVTPDVYQNGLGVAAPVLDLPEPSSRALDDGSIEVTLPSDSPPEHLIENLPFDENLAGHLPEAVLQSIASDLRAAVDQDAQSRKEWEEALAKGMDLLGIKIEDRSQPWKGACGVVQPMILEAAVRFQSKAVTRLFPAEGPASARVIGETDEKKIQAAKRVAADINYWLTEKMPEYRDESDQLLFALPVDGSAFKKIFWHPLLKRPMAQFVPASDFLMPYGFPNLETCPRYTHVMRVPLNEILVLQNTGFYRDISLARAPLQVDRVEEKVIRLSGFEPSYTQMDLVQLWEIHADLALEGERDRMSPYVVTMECDSNQVLSIYRNWREDDPDRCKVQSFVHYRYVPWKGPYGLGLVHLIGGIAKGSTSILRQLVDAGTLANLPGGLKSRQLRIKGSDDPIQPGEWRDADVPAGRIADSIYTLPYKEPSTVLFQLLQDLVEQGKSFASIADLDLSSATQNAPVGTMLALIERATEVIAAVYSRVHTALGRELALIAEIIRDHTPPEYEYPPAGHVPPSAKASDYDQLVSITPVSDPAASTMAQRVMVYQSALQLSSQAPQLYNLPLLHRSMLEVLGVDNANEIVPDKTEVEPADPVSENMALLTSKPVKAFEWQDHKAHLAVHQALSDDPMVTQAMQQNPLAASIASAGAAHIAEHVAFLYRQQIEEQMGAPLPPLAAHLPPEVEHQLSSLLAQAAAKVLAASKAQAAQQQAQQAQQDPVVQQQQQELQLKRDQAQQKARTDQAKLQLDAARIQQRAQSDQAKIASNERIRSAEIQAENARTLAHEHGESHRTHTKERAANLRHMGDKAAQHAELAASLAPEAQLPAEPAGEGE